MAKTLDFASFAPDLTALGGNTSELISGVIPQGDGYGPFKSLNAFTQALPANCRGYFFARKADGSIAVFAGTSTRLYQLNNSTFAWTDVSKGGSAYSTLVSDDNWKFAQFGDFVIAVQINTVPQKFVLSSGSAFVDLAGSPPQASHIAIINLFVVLTGLSSTSTRIHWSDLDAPETWTAGVGLCDFQDMPDGGIVHGISGGDAYGVLFQDDAIRMLIYAPRSSLTFNITRLATQDTLFARYSVVEASGRTFFLSTQGFKMIVPGGQPQAIGKERVDRYFFGDVDRGNLQLVIAAADPQATRVYWAYKSQAGDAGLFDKVLSYDWMLEKWTLLPISGEFLASLAKPGLTLEQLDAIAPTQLSVTGAANNGSGAIRLALSALSNSDFTVVGQNFIVVQGVVGTTEANGTWAFTVIDSTHIDLVGSTFTNAYVSGGKIGGSLDALPFSLDSVAIASAAAISAFDSNHKLGFFDGTNMEAILETSEQDFEGRVVFIEGARPMTDAAAALLSIGGRFTAQEDVSYTTESSIGTDGICPQLIETRYARGRMRIPAGSEWRWARGLQPEASLAGED